MMDLLFNNDSMEMLDIDIKAEVDTLIGGHNDISSFNFADLPPLDLDDVNEVRWLSSNSNFSNSSFNLDLTGDDSQQIVNPNVVLPVTNIRSPSPSLKESHLTFSPSNFLKPLISTTPTLITAKTETDTADVSAIRKDLTNCLDSGFSFNRNKTSLIKTQPYPKTIPPILAKSIIKTVNQKPPPILTFRNVQRPHTVTPVSTMLDSQSNVYCSAIGCNSLSRRNRNISFHLYPKQGITLWRDGEMKDLRRIWEIKLRCGKVASNSMVACSLHFETADFRPIGRGKGIKTYLRKLAIPSRRLAAPLLLGNGEPRAKESVKTNLVSQSANSPARTARVVAAPLINASISSPQQVHPQHNQQQHHHQQVRKQTFTRIAPFDRARTIVPNHNGGVATAVVSSVSGATNSASAATLVTRPNIQQLQHHSHHNSHIQHHQTVGACLTGGALTGSKSPATATGANTLRLAPPPVAIRVFPKPAYSYSCLIAMALKNSRGGSLPVSEIYNFMCKHFPYFKSAPNGWKNSVRHNLSLNKCFEKIEKPPLNGAQRKGCLWAMNPSKINKMDEEVQKWSRKDPLAIRRAMIYPETLEALELGEMKFACNYDGIGDSCGSADDNSSDSEQERVDGEDDVDAEHAYSTTPQFLAAIKLDIDEEEPQEILEDIKAEEESLDGEEDDDEDAAGYDIEVASMYDEPDEAQMLRVEVALAEKELLTYDPRIENAAKRRKTTYYYQR